jgi:hypothetical protein
MHRVQNAFSKPRSGRTTPMPRPKSELTKNGKTIGVRLTPSEYEEYVKLGKSKWVRKLLRESRNKKVQNDRTN